MSSSFVEYIKILGKGRHGSRSLTQEEAYKAMSLILANDVAPEQMGAFWMLIRIREETPEEAAGFTQAIRDSILQPLQQKVALTQPVDLDWPAYAGKRNELPWFLLAAFALAQSGYKVAMHGHSFPEDSRLYIDQVLPALGLPIVQTEADIETQLTQSNFVYLPLQFISPQLVHLMHLKRLLGLRSPVNTVVRIMNPLAAKNSVHGVFHKNYDELHIATCQLLHDPSVLVFRGGNGEAEVNPERDVSLGLLKTQSGSSPDSSSLVKWSQWPKASEQHVRQKDNMELTRLIQHWKGDIMDEFGELAIRHTMASVLGMLTNETDMDKNITQARDIWQARDKEKMIG